MNRSLFSELGYTFETSGRLQPDGFDWVGMAIRQDVGFNRDKLSNGQAER